MSDETLFHLALEKPTAERPAFLEEACAGDEARRRRIEDLLLSHETPDSFLVSPAVNPEATSDSDPSQIENVDRPDRPDPRSIGRTPPNDGPGSFIGPYKLLQSIGEGGMGAVYMAEQRAPVHRMVALKLIKAGMDSRQILARFSAERQALALMDHPNIARVFDAGTTEQGLPYFVMELVKGIPITRFCDERRLTTRERLELAIPVCQAVQHAHQKGIIHRDLKPSNVLIALYDGKPVPKIIDFGVAKATGPRLTDQTLYTEFGAVVGTLEYMSPEQAQLNQLDIDTRSDIYSLGVLIYELLTGSTPLDRKRLKQGAILEMLRVIREEESPRPSLRLSTTEELPSIAACRNIEPRKLSGLVRGELDWIVMKALEKDRNRRYETANGLAADLRRYLDDEPVQACPPSAAYRLRKFARRNRAALAVALAIGALLVSAVVVLTIANYRIAQERNVAEREHERAEMNLRKARRAVDTMFTEVAEKWLGRRVQLEDLQKSFLSEAADFYRDLAEGTRGKPELRVESANSYRRMALILAKLGNRSQAEEAFEQSIGLLEELTTEFPLKPAYRTALAESLHDYGRSSSVDVEQHLSFKEKLLRQALSHREKLATEYPDVAVYRRDVAFSLAGLANVLDGMRRFVEAVKASRQALELMEGLPAELAGEPGNRFTLGEMHADLANSLEALGASSEVVEEIARSRAVLEKLVADFPLDPEYRSELAWTCRDQASWLGATRPQDALTDILRSIDLQERLAAESPSIPGYRKILGLYYQELGNLLRKLKRYKEAEGALNKSIILLQKAVTENAKDGRSLTRLVESYLMLARIRHQSLGRSAEAMALYREAIRLGPDNVGAHNELAWLLATLPDMKLRVPDESVRLARRAVELGPKEGNNWNTLGVAQYRKGDWRAAIDALTKSMDLLAGKSESFNTFFLAMAHWQLGDKPQARSWYETAVTWMEKNQPKNEELIRFRAEAVALLRVNEK